MTERCQVQGEYTSVNGLPHIQGGCCRVAGHAGAVVGDDSECCTHQAGLFVTSDPHELFVQRPRRRIRCVRGAELDRAEIAADSL